MALGRKLPRRVNPEEGRLGADRANLQELASVGPTLASRNPSALSCLRGPCSLFFFP